MCLMLELEYDTITYNVRTTANLAELEIETKLHNREVGSK